MKKMRLMDASWLAVESASTPMHVGIVQVFTVPQPEEPNYIERLYHQLLADCTDLASPWALHPARYPVPRWEIRDQCRAEEHVYRYSLLKGSDHHALMAYVRREHEKPLQRSLPMWACHVIEGLGNNRFALYFKIHHALIDGISGVRLMQRVFSSNEKTRNMPAPWTNRAVGRCKTEAEVQTTGPDLTPNITMQALELGLKGLLQARDLGKAAAHLFKPIFQTGPAMQLPFTSPVTPFNKRITRKRDYLTSQFDLKRLRNLARTAGVTLNDLVLYLCGSALRSLLVDWDELPEQTLTAGVPVDIRPKDNEGTGTMISFMIVSLGTHLSDPASRLRAINRSSAQAKTHLQSLPRKLLVQYTLLLMSPYMAQLRSGLGGHTRPVFNLTVSNIPGPDHSLYFEGSRLEAMYPVSLVAHGNGLNITCISYNSTLTFGFTACALAVPGLASIDERMQQALHELEEQLDEQTPAHSELFPAKAGLAH